MIFGKMFTNVNVHIKHTPCKTVERDVGHFKQR